MKVGDELTRVGHIVCDSVYINQCNIEQRGRATGFRSATPDKMTLSPLFREAQIPIPTPRYRSDGITKEAKNTKSKDQTG